ncbi:hypothetical protein [Vibrio alginolyticus]|uniref:hypothetical protein n=1 Tax=Vibrio alginolyticus TaxID=663 RepID=UPI002FF25502
MKYVYRFSIVFTLFLFFLVVGLYSLEFYIHGLWSSNFTRFSAISVLLGASTAITVWLSNQVRQNSEDLLEETKHYYEKSYETLNVLGEDGFPKNQRIRWLTAARLLSVAEKLHKQIPLSSHKKLCEEAREYWRHKFYDLLLPNKQGPNKNYFAEDIKFLDSYRAKDPEPLELNSVLMIFRFVEWQDSREDPLENVPMPDDKKINKMKRLGPVGLAQLLEAYKKSKEQT